MQLNGITILSMAEQFPGPFATMLLSDLGADVVLVERFPEGDPGRRFKEYFAAMGRNKRSVLLDLKSDDGRGAFLELARGADVVLEGFRPGTVDRLGVGYEAVRAVNERIVYASISGFGQDGPYVTWPAHDISSQGLAGVLAHLYAGAATDEDANPPLVAGDLSSAIFTALAVMVALFERERSGRGDYIDVAMADCVTSLMTPAVLPAVNGAGPDDVPGNLGVANNEPGYGIFRGSDGRFLTISLAYEDHFWDRLCELIGLDELVGISFRERNGRYAELRGALKRRIGEQPAAHWLELFQREAIPAGPVLDLDEVPADPQLRHRGIFSGPGADGRIAALQPALFASVGRGELRRPVPDLGEHTREVLEQAGVPAARIDAVVARQRELAPVLAHDDPRPAR